MNCIKALPWIIFFLDSTWLPRIGQMHENDVRVTGSFILGLPKQNGFYMFNIFPRMFRDESVLNPKTAFGRFPLQIGLLQLCP